MRVLLATAGLAPLTMALTARQDAACTRESLIEAADAYVAAQTAGSLEPLADFLAEDWTYRQDNDVMDASDGVLATKALTIDHRRTTADVPECASYTELISADAANP